MEDRLAAIWARVSSKGQAELSPESQVERVKTKLEALGYTIPPEFIFKVVWEAFCYFTGKALHVVLFPAPVAKGIQAKLCY